MNSTPLNHQPSDGSKPELLFQHKSGLMNVKVIGPRIGWGWNHVEYYCWARSRTEPGQFEKRLPSRRDDQQHI